MSDPSEWTLEGTATKVGLKSLPDQTFDCTDAEVFAVFRKGDAIRLEPVSNVEP